MTHHNYEAPEPFKKWWQRYEHADPTWLLGVWERTREPYVAPTLGKQEWA